MFDNILVPTDGSDLSEKAVKAAIRFASINGSKLVAISVVEPYPIAVVSEAIVLPDLDQYEQQKRELAEQVLKAVADDAKELGVTCETRVAVSFSPYEEIIKAAKACNCDAIFMASHGRKGLNKLFLGSETQKVLAHTTIPVMVFR